MDLKKLGGKRPSIDPRDPIQLFESLNRKTSHTELRPAQEEALKGLRQRRTEPDLILKLPTGMGKSTVGLLYLYSHLIETRTPVVYLCPTTQLVDQVLAEAGKLGIPAHAYKVKQPYSHPDCVSGQAVIVCTYDQLFNV